MAARDNLTGTTWWAGSDKYGPWTEAPAVRVLAEYPSESFAHLVLVETDEPNPRQFVFGIGWPEALPEPGRPLSARVFHPPEHWDGHSSLNLGALPFHSRGDHRRPARGRSPDLTRGARAAPEGVVLISACDPGHAMPQ